MSYRVRVFIGLLLSLTFMRADAADAPARNEYVARATFTTAIVNREPVDRVLVLAPPVTEIYFFTDLRNLKGRTVTHRWRYRGEVVSQVPFAVEGDRWRVYSKKLLPPDSFGEWSVTVSDDAGLPLYVELFRYAPTGVITTELP